MPQNDNALARAWARENDIPVGKRGRVEHSVMQAYRRRNKSTAAKPSWTANAPDADDSHAAGSASTAAHPATTHCEELFDRDVIAPDGEHTSLLSMGLHAPILNVTTTAMTSSLAQALCDIEPGRHDQALTAAYSSTLRQGGSLEPSEALVVLNSIGAVISGREALLACIGTGVPTALMVIAVDHRHQPAAQSNEAAQTIADTGVETMESPLHIPEEKHYQQLIKVALDRAERTLEGLPAAITSLQEKPVSMLELIEAGQGLDPDLFVDLQPDPGDNPILQNTGTMFVDALKVLIAEQIGPAEVNPIDGDFTLFFQAVSHLRAENTSLRKIIGSMSEPVAMGSEQYRMLLTLHWMRFQRLKDQARLHRIETALVKQLHRDGLSGRKIARILELSHSTVQARLKS